MCRNGRNADASQISQYFLSKREFFQLKQYLKKKQFQEVFRGFCFSFRTQDKPFIYTKKKTGNVDHLYMKRIVLLM